MNLEVCQRWESIQTTKPQLLSFMAYSSWAAMSTVECQFSWEVAYWHTCMWRTDIQWSWIRLNGLQPCVLGSSWGLFSERWGMQIKASAVPCLRGRHWLMLHACKWCWKADVSLYRAHGVRCAVSQCQCFLGASTATERQQQQLVRLRQQRLEWFQWLGRW